MSRRRAGSRRLIGRGAVVAAAWLLLLLSALAAVVWRQTQGIALERQLRALQAERAVVEAERVQLERRSMALGSRARVVRLARERLGMHLPADSEIVFLPIVGGETEEGAAPGRVAR